MKKYDAYYESELIFDSGKPIDVPLLSVCLSTYRVADCVELALKTILNQTCDDYEVVIQDDCSPDDTISVVLNYLKRCESWTARRVRVFRSRENVGILANRLRGFEHADGGWFIMADGDDFSPEYRIEKTREMLGRIEENTVLVVTNRYDWWEGTSYEEVINGENKVYDFGDSYFSSDDQVNARHPQGSNGFIVSRRLFEAFRGSVPETRIICDDPVLARRATLIGRIFIWGEPIFYCRRSVKSASGGGTDPKLMLLDVCNRLDLLIEDIRFVSRNHKVPDKVSNDVKHKRLCYFLDAQLADCSLFIWPFRWVRLFFVSRKMAVQAFKERIRLIFCGNIRASIRKRFGMKVSFDHLYRKK